MIQRVPVLLSYFITSLFLLAKMQQGTRIVNLRDPLQVRAPLPRQVHLRASVTSPPPIVRVTFHQSRWIKPTQYSRVQRTIRLLICKDLTQSRYNLLKQPKVVTGFQQQLASMRNSSATLGNNKFRDSLQLILLRICSAWTQQMRSLMLNKSKQSQKHQSLTSTTLYWGEIKPKAHNWEITNSFPVKVSPRSRLEASFRTQKMMPPRFSRQSRLSKGLKFKKSRRKWKIKYS